MLKELSKAPGFELKDQDGKTHKLSDYAGRKVVLFFYPKNFTPGCTKEVCSFRDSYELLKKKGVVLLGVSADSVESHKKFREKYSLPFPLLSDPEKKVIKVYGSLKEKSMFGNTFLGVQRSTFIIDEKGNLQKVFPEVNVSGHVAEVLDEL